MTIQRQSISVDSNQHPCLDCGACCSYYRVSFETVELSPEKFEVPPELVATVDANDSVMRGTDAVEQPRCIALTGSVGEGASCTIYENRPSPCRKFGASYEYGIKEPRCDEARAAFNLKPLSLRDYDRVRNRKN